MRGISGAAISWSGVSARGAGVGDWLISVSTCYPPGVIFLAGGRGRRRDVAAGAHKDGLQG
ncbi:MAG: hypothetical protein Hens3KO_13580 [Henriciella sp.]